MTAPVVGLGAVLQGVCRCCWHYERTEVWKRRRIALQSRAALQLQRPAQGPSSDPQGSDLDTLCRQMTRVPWCQRRPHAACRHAVQRHTATSLTWALAVVVSAM